jgi:iron complex outermembrane receptor protein
MKKPLQTVLLGIACLALAFSVSAQQGRQIEEVIITATKREQSLQDVSVAVSVIDREMVENAQMDNGTDIARLSPNVNVSYFGLPDQPKYSLRGAATTDFALNTSSATGTVVDEVNLAASYFGGPLLFDIERIEALRGPQGTLFGKNTTGGALHFITRAPSFESGGYINTSLGELGYAHVDGAVEAPLIGDKLAARLAFTYSRSDGFWENENPNGADLGDIDNKAARLSFSYQGEGWDGILRLVSSRSNPNAAGVIAVGTNPGGTNVIGVNPRVSPISGASYDRHQGFWDRSGNIDVETDGAYLTLNKEFENYTLTSITSSISGSFLNLVDADGSMNNLLHIDFYAESDEIQQDLRLTSNFDGAFNFIVGLYYFDEQSDIPTTTRLFEQFIRDPSFDPNIDPFANVPSFVETHYRQRRETFAAYFNSSLDLSDITTFNLGLRWTQDDGDLENFISTGTFLLPAGPLQVPFILDDPSNDMDYSDSDVTGEIGLDFNLSSGALLYGKYSRGYRSSAFDGSALFSSNQLSTADPETIDTIEFGYKTQLADNQVRLNSAVFVSRYNDLQFLNVISATESELVNEDAEMYGFEVEAMILASDNLQLSVGLGYLQGEYKDAVLNGVDISGNNLVEAPELNFNIAMDYDFNIGSDGLLILHLDSNFVDDQYFDAFNSDDVATDSFWNTNGRLIYTPDNQNWQFALWGKNLTDNDEFVGRIRASAVTSVFGIAPQPRRFGVEASYKF